MIKKWILIVGTYLFLLSSCSANTTPNSQLTLDVDSGKYALRPETKHYLTSKVVTEAITNYHYKRVALDDSLSLKIFNKYLNTLDPNKCIFIQQDINDFSPFKYALDNQLKANNLTAAFYIYNRYADRLSARINYALELIDTKLNLDSNDVYILDRKDAQWFSTLDEDNNYWNKRVRYELINQVLISKDEEKAYELVRKRYNNMRLQLDKLNSDEVVEAYLNSFTNEVEPHTAYLAPRTSEDFKIDMTRSIEGIGATLSVDNEYTKIVSLTKGGPAEKSNQLQPNDRIIAVAQGTSGEFEDVVGWRISDVVRKIRGPKGTVVKLQIIPAGADLNTTPKTIVLTRDKVILEDQKVKSEIKSVTLNGQSYAIGVIHIPAFYIDWEAMRKGDKNYTSTSRDVRNALINLQKENVNGIMIDLRSNGGGSLKEAIDLTGLFIKTGPVVLVRDAGGKVEVNRTEDAEIVYAGPLTVLVDRFSASASEIFAAAMQDYNRGVIIGSQSYGKGTVQTAAGIGEMINSREDLGQLNLTIAKFYRISGGSTQHKGVTPDISFPSLYSAGEFGESSEPTALPWDQIQATQYQKAGDLSIIIPALEKAHQERMQNNPEYGYILNDITELEKNRKKNEVVLNIHSMKEERDIKEEESLKRYNLRLEAKGKPPIEKGEERPSIKNDFIEDEGLIITAELIQQTIPVNNQTKNLNSNKK